MNKSGFASLLLLLIVPLFLAASFVYYFRFRESGLSGKQFIDGSEYVAKQIPSEEGLYIIRSADRIERYKSKRVHVIGTYICDESNLNRFGKGVSEGVVFADSTEVAIFGGGLPDCEGYHDKNTEFYADVGVCETAKAVSCSGSYLENVELVEN